MSDGGFDRRGPRQSGSKSTHSERGTAPGKTTRTSKLPPRARPSVQRRERAEPPEIHVKSPAEWMTDPGMLAAIGFVPEGHDAEASGASSNAVQRKLAGLPESGEPVDKVGIVSWDGSPPLRLRSAPDTRGHNVIAQLDFSTHVQVIKSHPGGWYFVSTPAGEMGYVAASYVWTHLPEPRARLHRVKSGVEGTAIAIAEDAYGEHADDWGQDLRFYVNVLGWANDLDIPDTTSGWREVRFQANDLIWIPHIDFARSMQGVVSSGSLSYSVADSLGVADFMERMGELWEDYGRAIELSSQYLGEAIQRHTEEALWRALEALALVLAAAGALLAVSTALGAAAGTLAGGAGAAPGAAAGFEVGMALLEWLGLAMLAVWIGDALVRVGSAFGQFIGTVWNARGDARVLDQGAREFAEAVGTLMGAIVEGVVLFAAAHGIGKAVGLLRGTRFGQAIGESRLHAWLSRRVQNAGEGRGPVPSPRSLLRSRRRQKESEGGQGTGEGRAEGREGGGGRDGEGRKGGESRDMTHPPREWAELRSQLSQKGQEGFDQAMELNGENAVEGMTRRFKNEDGTYDVEAADRFFRDRALSREEYRQRLDAREARALSQAQENIRRIDNIIRQTSPEGRPDATIGDATSEAALLHETTTGQPVGGKGHSLKVSESLNGLRDAIQSLEAAMTRIRDSSALSRIEAAIQRARTKIRAMEPAQRAWKSRVGDHPDVWNADGISKNYTQPDGSPWPDPQYR